MLKLFTALFLTINTFSFFNYPHNRKGITIDIENKSPSEIALKSGETIGINGSVCVAKYNPSSNKPKCYKLQKGNLPVRFYFPDKVTEVTDQVTFGNQGHEYNFSYQTPALNTDSENKFYVVVAEDNSRIKHLESIQAKLNKRILYLKNRLSHFDKKKGHEKVVLWIQILISKLEATSNKLDKLFSEDPSILATMEYPLQLDNNFAGNFKYTSFFSGYKLSVDVPLGSPIEGESTQVNASAKNLSNLSFWFPDIGSEDIDTDESFKSDGHNDYMLTLDFNGSEVFNSGVKAIGFGEEISYSYNTPKLSISDLNKIELNFYKNRESFIFKNKFFETPYGVLTHDLNVAEDKTFAVWSDVSPVNTLKYTQNMTSFSGILSDTFGRIDFSTLDINLDSTFINSNTESKHVSYSISDLDFGRKIKLDASFENLAEGVHEVTFSGADFAGNTVVEKRSFRVDRTKPDIFLGKQDGILTNDPSFSLPVQIIDHSPVEVSVIHNGAILKFRNDIDFTENFILAEGMNTIEIVAKDAAGNINSRSLLNIELDTIPPEIKDFNPREGDILSTLYLSATGSVDRPVRTLAINGINVNVGEDLNFAQPITAMMEGDFKFNIHAVDLAGNVTEQEINTQIILKVLNAELIRIDPIIDNPDKLRIVGIRGASRPNLELKLDAGFFNSKTINTNLDGSFDVELDFFREVNLSGFDQELNRGENFTLSYYVDTTLSGVINDLNDNPLPGVTVSLLGTDLSAVTNAQGIFSIPEPATGDQQLVLDGTTIPKEVLGEEREYFKEVVNITIGNREKNVIGKTLYLKHLIKDGSETVIEDENSSVVVTSPHAPGVEIEIPAGVTNFPDGSKSGSISISKVETAKLIKEIPSFIKTSHVYSLEPSGLTFSERVPLKLPNENKLAAGSEVLILSKNSQTGAWEIGGLASVDDSGDSVVTKDDSGILHFSEIMAVPRAPKISEFGSIDKVGADNTSGGVSTTISLPTYKTLGKDFGINLTYNSNWANPNAVVQNMFDIPRNEMTFFDRGIDKHSLYRIDYVYKSTVWTQPNKIESNFIINNQSLGEKQVFTGMPNKSVLSYQVDVGSQPSGIHPYVAKYDIHLENMSITTVSAFLDKKIGGSSVLAEDQVVSTSRYILNEVFPSDVSGNLVVQNKKNSEAGRGWKIGGVSKILNPGANRLVLEGEDGKTQVYTVNNFIDTAYRSENGNLSSLASNSLNEISIVDDKNKIMNFTSASEPSLFGTIPVMSGRYEWQNLVHTWRWECWQQGANYNKYRQPEGMVSLEDGRKIIADRSGGMILMSSNGTYSNLFGRYTSTPNGYNHDRNWFCGREGVECAGTFTREVYQEIICWKPVYSAGAIQEAGFADGSLSSAAFNGPMGITAAASPSSIIVADSGNHRVRKINLATNSVETIAGNGATTDLGDGGLATDASIYHPRGVVSDSAGNIYVSSERGLIRKIDSTGRITHFAGSNVNDSSAVLSDRAHIKDMIFTNPYGLALDEENAYLYVADTGNNRVVRIDMKKYEAMTVAGNGKCESGNIGDKGSALNASLCGPTQLALDKDKNLLILDRGHNRVRKVIFNNSENSETTYLAVNNQPGTYVKKLSDSSYKLVNRDGSNMIFDQNGLLLEANSLSGLKMTYEYEDGKIKAIADPSGSQTLFNYFGDGKLAEVIDPANRITRFSYSGVDLQSVTFPDGTGKRFIYDEKGLLLEEYNQRDKKTAFIYNDWDRVHKVVNPIGAEVILNDIKSASMVNDYSNSNPGKMNSLDDENLVDGIVDTKGNSTVMKKDESGFVNTITDAEGKITEVERDLDGRPLKITRPDSSTVIFEYAPITFDLVRKLDSSTGVEVKYFYNDVGLLLKTTENDVVVEENSYDEFNQLISKTNRLGQKAQYEYNSLGLVIKKIAPDGSYSSFSYDSLGNIESSTDSLGKVTSFSRDDAGNIVQIVNAEGHVVKREYDEFNRLTSVISNMNEKTSYVYSETGQLLSIVDPRMKTTSFTYDNLDQLVQKVDPVGRTTSLHYDTNGNIVKEIDPAGNVKTFEYNKLDKLTKKVLPDDSYELAYDSRGNVTMVKNSINQINFEYDHLEGGDVITVAGTFGVGARSDLPSFDLEYEYDVNGNRTALIDGDEVTSYEYDIGNRLRKITNHKNEVFSFEYDAKNRLSLISRPGSETSYSFYDNDVLSQILHKSGTSTISSFDYVINGIGNITKKRTLAGDFDYGYDGNNQLSSASNPETLLDEVYQYDSLGNRTADQSGSYSYDQTGQKLQEDYKNLYYYDNNGNLSSKIEKSSNKVTNYIYNSENRLVQYKEFDASANLLKQASYAYDALGRRIEKVVTDLQVPANNKTRRYVYDGEDILLVLNESNETLSKYTHSSLRIDDALAIDDKTNNKSYYFLKDHLGSVVDIVNDDLSFKQHYAYSAFGKILAIKDGSGNDVTDAPLVETHFTFTGREWDAESGLYYYRARYYSPEIGHFLSVDPDAGQLTTPITHINKYTYVSNNPILYTDPSGASIFDSLGKWGSVALGGVLFGPIGQLAAVNFSGQFSEKDIKFINTAAIVAGIVAIGVIAGPAIVAGTTFETTAIAAGSALIQASFQDGNFLENFAINFGVNLILTPVLTPSGGDIIGESIAGAGFGAFLGVTNIQPFQMLYNSRESVQLRERTYFPKGKL